MEIFFKIIYRIISISEPKNYTSFRIKDEYFLLVNVQRLKNLEFTVYFYNARLSTLFVFFTFKIINL